MGPPGGFLTRFPKVFEDKIANTQKAVDDVFTDLGWNDFASPDWAEARPRHCCSSSTALLDLIGHRDQRPVVFTFWVVVSTFWNVVSTFSVVASTF